MPKTIKFHIPKQMTPEDRGTQIKTHPYKLHPNSTIINFIKTHMQIYTRSETEAIKFSVQYLFLNVLKTPDFFMADFDFRLIPSTPYSLVENLKHEEKGEKKKKYLFSSAMKDFFFFGRKSFPASSSTPIALKSQG